MTSDLNTTVLQNATTGENWIKFTVLFLVIPCKYAMRSMTLSIKKQVRWLEYNVNRKSQACNALQKVFWASANSETDGATVATGLVASITQPASRDAPGIPLQQELWYQPQHTTPHVANSRFGGNFFPLSFPPHFIQTLLYLCSIYQILLQ